MPSDQSGVIRVGLTERHGMADEFSRDAGPFVEYSFLKPTAGEPPWLRSPIKGYLGRYSSTEHDLIESILYPIRTSNAWLYSCANLQEATAFGFFGAPLPRALRVAYIRRLLMHPRCKRVVVWSQAGLATFCSYGRLEPSDDLLSKVTVVYPAVRRVADEHITYSDGDGVSFLFSGDFFRKGGVNVIDAFETLQSEFPRITLRLCCDKGINFRTANNDLRQEYLARISANPRIELLGRVSRDELLRRVFPLTDVYLLPTYVETFGFAILEAMACGVPVVSTRHFAIPEMIEDGQSGFLVDTSGFDCDRLFKGYVVDAIPHGFREHVTEGVYEAMRRLIESPTLRKEMGQKALAVARTKFSSETRQESMLRIYREALGPSA